MNQPVPKFAYVIVATALVSLVLTALVAWRVDLFGQEEEARDCARSVAAREDNRTMWLYLVDTNKSADQARVDAFVAELNKRLPELVCVDGNPVPESDGRVG